MKRWIVSLAAGVGLAMLGAPAYATETSHPIKDSVGCPNAEDWYTNQDEGDNTPTQKADGWLFEGKDLIHHATGPLDLADVKGGDFTAEGSANKLVFKMETTAPYSTIVQTPDGKFWSSKVPAGKGSQAAPVDKVIDLTDSDVIEQPGKEYTGATKVTTFGVGYWTESGETLVKSIKFRGKTYKTDCQPVPSTSASPSSSATTKPTSSAPTGTASTDPTSNTSTSNAPVPGSNSGGLPVTGPSVGLVVALGGILVIGGIVTAIAVRRRNTRFTA